MLKGKQRKKIQTNYFRLNKIKTIQFINIQYAFNFIQKICYLVIFTYALCSCYTKPSSIYYIIYLDELKKSIE